MLANVAHSWGAEVTSDGKVVWALLSARRDAVPAL
jgi:hypothetical protein